MVSLGFSPDTNNAPPVFLRLSEAYVRAAEAPEAPVPAPYPVQRGLTRPMSTEAAKMLGPTERTEGSWINGWNPPNGWMIYGYRILIYII